MMRFVFALFFAAALAFPQLPAGKTVVGSYALGAESLTTANRVPVVASAGTLGQSDVSLASGIFSRAGTLGLSATGANILTFSTNGSERGRFTSGGDFGLGTASPTNTAYFTTFALNGVSGGLVEWKTGDVRQAVAYSLSTAFVIGTTVSTPVQIITGNAERMRVMNTTGNVLVGTTTDDGSSKLQVAGAIVSHPGAGSEQYVLRVQAYAADDAYRLYGGGYQLLGTGGFITPEITKLFSNNAVTVTLTGSNNALVGGVTDGNFRLDVQSSGSTGTMRVYDQTAVTGSSTLVVRAGAGQSTTALQTWQNNAGTTLASITSSGSLVALGATLQDASANSYVGVRMTNDAQTWDVATVGGDSDNFVLSDITNSKYPFKVGVNTASNTLVLNSTGIGFFGVTPVARQTALTAADATALNTGDAGSDAVIGNIRTRLGELETKLQAYGLLN